MLHPLDNEKLVRSKIRTFIDAVQLLQDGGLVIYPTETFFALGCTMTDALALEGIYGAKQRPQQRPLPLIAAHMEQVEAIAQLSAHEKTLVDNFWPGPLTLICTAKSCVSPLITANTGKVAIRISPHPVAMALAEEVGEALVCSSANISGEPPAVMHTHVSAKLLQRVQGIIIDGPIPSGGLPSTIVEVLANGKLRMARQGAITEQDLHAQGWQCNTIA